MTSAISSSSGAIDVQSLVNQLMTIEQKPLNKLNAKVADEQTKISSWGTLSSLVSGFQSSLSGLTTGLQAFSTTSSNTSSFTATADNTAIAGNYNVKVTQLAQTQNLVAAGQVSSSATIGNGSATTMTFDFGTISGSSFTTNGSGTKSITIDSTNNTLQGIRDTINSANIGVSASIINDGSNTPYRLVINPTNSGVNNSLKITTTGGDGTINNLVAFDPAGVQKLTQTMAAQNATATINGIAITSATNNINNAIQGVNLSLVGTTVKTESLAVAKDPTAITNSINDFVSSYNAISSQLVSRSAYGNGSTSPGSLAGDHMIRAMQSQLQKIFNTPVAGGSLNYLAQIGVSFQTDGSLKVDNNLLSNAINNKFVDFNNLLSSTSGVATQLNNWATSVLSPGNGLIATSVDSLNSAIATDNKQISQLNSRLATIQQQYIAQYTNLNMILGSMNTTSAYLTANFK
jgi:flagellar hook-associated protein 2